MPRRANNHPIKPITNIRQALLQLRQIIDTQHFDLNLGLLCSNLCTRNTCHLHPRRIHPLATVNMHVIGRTADHSRLCCKAGMVM